MQLGSTRLIQATYYNIQHGENPKDADLFMCEVPGLTKYAERQSSPGMVQHVTHAGSTRNLINLQCSARHPGWIANLDTLYKTSNQRALA